MSCPVFRTTNKESITISEVTVAWTKKINSGVP